MGFDLILLISFAMLAIAAAHSIVPDQQKWETFKLRYNKKYASPLAESFRMSVFLDAEAKIMKHNLLSTDSVHLKLDEYADLQDDEFSSIRKGYMGGSNRTTEVGSGTSFNRKNSRSQDHDSMDWRMYGAVTRVKNQGRCASCWAFAAAGVLEYKTWEDGNLVELSEQNLVDCVTRNNGCRGGWAQNVFQYVQDNPGINTEISYLYEDRQYQCRFNTNNVGATCRGPYNLRSGDEGELKTHVYIYGPVAIAVDSRDYRFRYYAGGIYYGKSCSSSLDRLDHAMLLVGYGSEDGKDYWIVKNSWGEWWGEKGYIRMSRNRNNNCGIATDASWAHS